MELENQVVVKIHDAGNKKMSRKRDIVFSIYALILLLNLIVNMFVELNSQIYFFISIFFVSYCYFFVISKMVNKETIQDIIIDKDVMSISSEDDSYKIDIKNILTIERKNNSYLLFVMIDGTEKTIKTNKLGFIKLMSNILNNETLRSKINFQTMF